MALVFWGYGNLMPDYPHPGDGNITQSGLMSYPCLKSITVANAHQDCGWVWLAIFTHRWAGTCAQYILLPSAGC